MCIKSNDKTAEKEKVVEKETKELIINGRYYDVTNMKHPGGSVIYYYANKASDATEAFEEFHKRSKHAHKLLASLPSRPVDKEKREKEMLPGQQALLNDFRELTEDLKREGYFNPVLSHVAYRIVEMFAGLGLGLYLLREGYILGGLIVIGLYHGRVAGLTHEAGHYSLTGNIQWDRFLEEVLYGLGNGKSSTWWRNQHNKHHATPQKLGYDVDVNTLPLVAFTEKIAIGKNLGISQKYWIRFQTLLFPLVINFAVMILWQFLIHPRHIIRTKKWSEVPWLLLRYIIFGAVIGPKYGVVNTILLYLASQWFSGNHIFHQTALAHTHLGTVSKDDESIDWVRYCSMYTMNVESGPFDIIDWLMVFLNMQVEHHLWPAIPQFRLKEITPRVKKLFQKHGLPYQTTNYFDALYKMYANLHKVGADVFLG